MPCGRLRVTKICTTLPAMSGAIPSAPWDEEAAGAEPPASPAPFTPPVPAAQPSPSRGASADGALVGQSPGAMEAESLLAGMLGSTAQFADANRVLPDTSSEAMAALVNKATARGAALADFDTFSPKALVVMYDVHKLFHMGADMPAVIKRLGHVLRTLLKNEGGGPNGELSHEELISLGGLHNSAARFADLVSATRLDALAKSLRSTAMCVALFDMCFSSLFHPPGWKIVPVAEPGVENSGARTASVPVSGVSISLSGAGKSHVPSTFYDLALLVGERWPASLAPKKKPPMDRVAMNMSKLSDLAKEHGHFGWFPDEYTKACAPGGELDHLSRFQIKM